MGTSLHLLLVENNENDAVLLTRALRKGGYELRTFLRVETLEDMRAALINQRWDIIIADYSMARFTGLDALEIFKEFDLDIPFLMVSDTVGEDVAVTAMKSGAHDYIIKGQLARLIPAIERELHEASVRRARRKAEQQVGKLSRAVEQSPSLVIITNLDGNIEYVNPKFTEVSGYTLAEVEGRNPRFLKSGHTPLATYKQLWANLQAGETWRGELNNRRKDGQLYWISATLSPIKNTDGVTTHYLSVQEDITERKQAEQDLRASEERFRRLVEHSPDAILVLTQEGTILNVNQQACESLGYTRQAILGKNVSEIEGTLTAEELHRPWQQMTQNRPVTLEGTHIRRDGSTFPVEIRLSHFETRDEQLILATVRDMTERHNLQAKLRRYNEQLEELVTERTHQLGRTMEQLQAILNNSSDAIALAQPNGDIQAANPAFRELFGYRVDEALEELLGLLDSPTHVEAMTTSLFDVLQLNTATRVEVTVRRQDGSRFDADVALTPVTNHSGDMVGLVMSLRDITHLKEIDRFKTRFVANAAHDLANPITNLKMHLYAVRHAPDRLPQHLEALENQTRRLESLVQDLRMLSHLDQHTAQFDLEPLDLNELVAAVVTAHLPLAEAKSQALSFQRWEEPLFILADRDKFERVLINLLTNALNYTPEGGTITINSGSTAYEVVLRTTDTGIGIAPEHLPHIFERFFRSDDAKTSGIDGTGLGLAIVKEIVEAHQGTITVKSVPQQGSTFTVWLPQATPDDS